MSSARKNNDRGGRGFEVTRRRFLKYSGAAGAAGVAAVAMSNAAHAADPAIKLENQRSGAAPDVWESDGDSSIVGYTTGYSYLPGETVTFKILSDSTDYTVRIFRIGWYAGKGARHLADVEPSVVLPQSQPEPHTEAATGLVDCGNWAPSAEWVIPSDAVSGVYYALFQRADGNPVSNHTIFVVRRPGPCDILVQTSEMTMHAYNRYGGNSLYFGEPVGRAFKVSYNRPFGEGDGAENDFFNAEVALVRFLERNGYDVAYCGGIDVHQNSAVLSECNIFVSSGHDEYVSREQREHVTAARDSGVHLIFMTGNEYFWKVRFEPAIDGSGTPDRTMVCYKETLNNAKIDPSSEWTGTWRDPRFSPPSNGGQPENALTGQLFRAILPVSNPDLEITVPSDYRALRFWRNTPVASLPNGAVATLAPSTLGYEFDVDADNGFRPPGLIRLSETVATVPQLLLDYGATYAPGTCTHTMTLYRAASGALVWGTGTVQWSYGLDSYHVADWGTPTDAAMQQATVNILADMGAQPTTLMAGLSPAAASTDTLPPTVSIQSPTENQQHPIGSPLVLSGTAVDSGGGVVAGVEVSLDGGSTWRAAVGRDSWSFVMTPMTLGPTAVQVRAIDDSANIGQAALVTIVGIERAFPMSIWPVGTMPGTPSSSDAGAIECGVRFRAAVDGFITGIRFYKGSGNLGEHLGRLWTNDGHLLAEATFTNESAVGWQEVAIPPVAILAGQTHVASVFMPEGHYAVDAGYFQSAFELSPLRALAHGEDGSNGVYRYGSAGFPTSTFGAANYWVDVVLHNDNGMAPTVTSCEPGPGLLAVAGDALVRATFNEAMLGDSIAIELRVGDAPVTGSVSYDHTTRTATFTPADALTPAQAYTATVTAAADAAGNPMAEPFSWTFTTDGGPGSSPATLWSTAATPELFSTETSPIELGTRFVSSAGGTVTALRFFKAAGSQGPHIGHLWGPDEELLASAVYSAETDAGWQQVELSEPVELAADTQYTVSYYAPHGRYGASPGYFSGSGSRVREPLTAPSANAAGGNGVYRYGSSAYPGSSNGGNYWADVVVVLPPDTAPPAVVNVEPAPSLLAVGVDTAVHVTFDEAIQPGTAQLVVQRDSTAVAGAVTYDADTFTLTFTPGSQLVPATTYTATISGAQDLGGLALTEPLTWTFTTDGPGWETLWVSTDLPAIIETNDAAGVEVGVRVRPSVAGAVAGLRFYKGSNNQGPHIGRLWADDGTLLASVTFESTTRQGWQQALFATPVPVSAGADYVASYHAPHGRYAITAGGLSSSHSRGSLTAPAAPNGVFGYGAGGFPTSSYNGSNYWVDVLFADTSGPQIAEREPGPGATGIALTATIDVTFDEPISPGTLVMTLRDSAGGVVEGTTAYDPATFSATFTPSSELEPGSSYTAAVEAAEDLVGNAIGAAASWSFMTESSVVATLWSSATVPSLVLVQEAASIELGVRFSTSAAGAVSAIRFYKGGTQNTGPHVVNLWGPDGELLATATTSSESARGWQSATLPSPIQLVPGTTYTASYFTSAGYYSLDTAYFNPGPHVSGPLTAHDSSGPGNGVFRYDAESGYPTSTYNGSNYWVDVVFHTDSP